MRGLARGYGRAPASVVEGLEAPTKPQQLRTTLVRAVTCAHQRCQGDRLVFARSPDSACAPPVKPADHRKDLKPLL